VESGEPYTFWNINSEYKIYTFERTILNIFFIVFWNTQYIIYNFYFRIYIL